MPQIGVNLLWLVPGVVGGSEEYTIRLLLAMADQKPTSLDVRLYGQPCLFEEHRQLAERFTPVVAPPLPSSKIARVGLEKTWLRLVSKDDVLVHHAGGVIAGNLRGAPVLTVHDIQPLDMPHNFSWLKRRWLKSMIPSSVKAAQLIITPSQFTADRLVDEFGIKPEKIEVVAHGHRFDEVDPQADRSAEDRDRPYGRFMLYPAITYPHKRHIDLIDALGELAPQYHDLNIVFTGRRGPLHDHLVDHVSTLGLCGRVHFTGRVPENVLDELYRSAVATVIPSEYEGFGNPALEAMSRRCPVVAANAGALPEVLGGAGILVPTRSPKAIADAMRTLLDSEPTAQSMGTVGHEQARRYSWESSGRSLLASYRRVVNQSGVAWSNDGGNHE